MERPMAVCVLTDAGVITLELSFFGRHVAIHSIEMNDRDQFAALFPVQGKCDVAFFCMEIPSWIQLGK
jgi:hypothetical protein